MVLVTLVPMFAPMIIGIAVSTGTFAATNPTMIEVDVDEDWNFKLMALNNKNYNLFWFLISTCTRTVTRTPIITPTIGLFSRSEFLKKAARKGIS